MSKTKEIEIWRDIPDYEGLYQVSTLGNVKSLSYKNSGKERLLKPSKNNDGYFQVKLYKNGEGRKFTAHRIVALAFISNPENLPQINHKNEIKTDNRVENLEWVTPKENCNYGTRNERKRYKMRKPILQYTKDGVFIREWDSATNVEKELNLSQGNITKCCKEKLKSAYGFVWRYKNVG